MNVNEMRMRWAALPLVFRSTKSDYSEMAELAHDAIELLDAAQKRIAELEALLKECHTTMNHAEVFIATREKMHPTGQELYRELLEQIDKALTGEPR